MQEVWKPIIIEKNGVVYNFEGEYEVSNMGRVRSLNFNNTGKIQILKLVKNEDGYFRVSIRRKNFLVHRLVATAFIPNKNGLLEVNHINHVRTDCRVENLEWCDRNQNIAHSNIKRTKVICIETGQVFNTVKEAKQWLGKGDIRSCLKGRQKTAGGYHWMYYDEYMREQ